MRLLSRSAEETVSIGRRLASLLKRGDAVCLYGGLGSGKTTLVKGIASSLGIPERDITSASFTIVAEYTARLGDSLLPFYHIDLYRIANVAELDSIGVEEYIGKDGISIVEWAERLGQCDESVSVSLSVLDHGEREIIIEGVNEAVWNNLQARQD